MSNTPKEQLQPVCEGASLCTHSPEAAAPNRSPPTIPSRWVTVANILKGDISQAEPWGAACLDRGSDDDALIPLVLVNVTRIAGGH